MLSQSTRQELFRLKESLEAQLENNPIYKQLQAISQFLSAFDTSESRETVDMPPLKPPISIKDRSGQMTTAEEREAMVNEAIAFWAATNNVATTMRSVADELVRRGITIKGQRAGTTLGAVVSKRLTIFECVDKKQGLWRLTPHTFAAAQAKTSSHIRPAA